MAKKQNGLYLFPEVEDITEDLTDEQLGQVVRAAFAYRRCGEGYNGKDCMVKLVCRMIFSQLQRGEEVSRQKQAAARARWGNAEEMHPDAENMQTDTEEMHKDAEVMHTDAEPMQSDAPIQSNPIQSSPIHTSPIQSFPKAYVPAGGKAPFGKFGWVKLTRQEYAALDRELGRGELERCIGYLDELCQSNGNKNRYQDWALVIRRCHSENWGRRRETARKNAPIYGCNPLGAAELEAIQRVLKEDVGSQ